MTTGKNKLLRFCRLYFGGYDLSGDSRTFSSLVNTFEAVDVTGLSDDCENFLSDKRRKVGIKGYQALLNDTAGKSFAILSNGNVPQALVTSVFIGGGAAPAAGDMAYLLPAVQLADTTEFSQMIGALSTDFELDAAQMSSLIDTPIGMVLLPKTDLTITANGSAVNGVAQSTAGGHANLHVFTSSGGTWAFTIEDSADGSSGWATIATFTANGSAVTAENKTISGTIKQYTRLVFTRTSGTCTVACAFARN